MGSGSVSGASPATCPLKGYGARWPRPARGRSRDPEFVSLPRQTGSAARRPKYHDPSLMNIKDEDLVDVGWTTIERALDTFQSSESLLLAAGERSKVSDMGLIIGGDVTILQERIAIGSTLMPGVQSDESTLMMSFVTAMVEKADSKGHGLVRRYQAKRVHRRGGGVGCS